jgi:hypothetical protein
MQSVFTLSSVVLLTAIAYQDFRYRKISLYLFLALLFCIISTFFFSSVAGGHNSFLNIGINFLFVLLLLAGGGIYFFLTKRGAINIIDSYIGKGDILFLLIASLLLSPVNFISFCLVSFILTLLTLGTIQIIRRKDNSELPLAGVMSVVLLLCFLFNYRSGSFSFHDDSFLLSKLPILP